MTKEEEDQLLRKRLMHNVLGLAMSCGVNDVGPIEAFVACIVLAANLCREKGVSKDTFVETAREMFDAATPEIFDQICAVVEDGKKLKEQATSSTSPTRH